jgi:hypothetical protein
MRRTVARLVILALVPSLGMAATALAASDDALWCQSAIGQAGRAYAVARLRAIVACNNDTAAGESCDAVQRDRALARAARALAKTTAKACRDVALETLNFPADARRHQGSFCWGISLHCIGGLHDGITYDALAFEYPDLQTFSGGERRCQRGLARAAGGFIATDMRIRTRCLDAWLRGSLPESVDCVADVPPYGDGTEDAATDDAVRQAINRLTSRLRKACAGADLARLGFPGRCADADGGELDLAYVEPCMRAEHAYVARFMLRVEYPPVDLTPTSGGTPSPTATPRLNFRLAPSSQEVRRFLPEL